MRAPRYVATSDVFFVDDFFIMPLSFRSPRHFAASPRRCRFRHVIIYFLAFFRYEALMLSVR